MLVQLKRHNASMLCKRVAQLVTLGSTLLCTAAWSAVAAEPSTTKTPSINQYAAADMQLSQESVALLEDRISYWYERQRPDRMEEVIQQLLRVHPKHPHLLEMQAMLAVLQRDNALALALYQQLAELAPDNPATMRLKELIALDSEQQDAVSNARLLSIAGRYAEAAIRWRQVFPNAPTNPELALDFWETHSLISSLPAEPSVLRKEFIGAAALAQLEAIQRAHPNSVRAEITVLRTRLYLGRLNQNNYERLIALSSDNIYGQEAAMLFRHGAASLPANSTTLSLLARAHNAMPTNGDINDIYQRVQQEVNAERRLNANPYYQKRQQGLRSLENEQNSTAETLLKEALVGRPTDPAILGGLGYATMRQGRHTEALSWFKQAAKLQPDVEQWPQLITVTTFWGGLEQFDAALASANYPLAQQLLTQLDTQPLAQEHNNLLLLRQAQLNDAKGDKALAYQGYLQVLLQDPSSSQAAWQAFAYVQTLNDIGALQQFYHKLSPSLQQELHSEYLRVSAGYYKQQADTYTQAGELDQAHNALLAAYQLTPDDPWLVNSLAQSYEQRDEPARAAELFQQLTTNNQTEDARFAYALYLARQGRDQEAQASLANINEQNYTAGMQALQVRLNERAIQTGGAVQTINVAEAAPIKETVLYIGFDRSEKDGTPGITALNAKTVMLDLRVPFAEQEGYWFLRADPTWLNAGAADLDDSYWRNRLGTGVVCTTNCPTGVQPATKEFGVALGAGAEFSDWWFDIGRSPVGFNRSEWVGGIGIRRALGEFGMRLRFDRRIQTATLISFAGMQDPFSERNWGAVTRNGVNLGFSWDQGGALGWWSSLGYEKYRGYNVADNARWYGYTGGYWRAYETEPVAITVGVTTLFWGFDKDLSNTTFGQGHYYSPELYKSISLPLTVFGRIDRFSYLVRGAIGYSDTQLGATDFFPTDPALQNSAMAQQDNTGVLPVWEAGTGGGFSSSLVANIEYQLNRSWYVGMLINLVRSETFSPNQGQIYLRYHFGGNNLPVARPPDPPTRYVDR